MELYGIEVNTSSTPPLEPDFFPILLWTEAYKEKAREPLTLAISNSQGQRMVYQTKIRGDVQSHEADKFYVDRLLKTLLWMYGGHRVSVVGPLGIFRHLEKTFSLSGSRTSEVVFMSNVYDQPFLVEQLSSPPRETKQPQATSQLLNGYRIGVDINSHDRKCAAVANGIILYTEEVLWDPMAEEDPEYHFKGVVESIHAAARRLPRIDSIGVATAGVFLNNQARTSELFHSIPAMEFSDSLIDLYPRAAKAMGCQNLVVHSEGDVSALAGSMSLDAKGILSLHFGANMTAGYLDNEGCFTSWLNELAYVPVNLNPEAPQHEQSQDRGCGNSYFSEEGLLRMADDAGIFFHSDHSNQERIRQLIRQADQGSSRSKQVFESMGICLGHALAYYHSLYSFQMVLLIGRMMSGVGGDLIFDAAQRVLAKDYPVAASNMVISLPKENTRRVCLAVAAASMPEC